MSIATVLLDIKCHIASFDPDVWYLMYLYDPEFADFVRTRGIALYKKNFNVSYITLTGDQVWMLFGRYHREGDLPAICLKNGDVRYMINGMTHRDNNSLGHSQPACICINAIEYYYNGLLHRNDENDESLPAVIHPGRKEYYCNGLRHRANDKNGKSLPAYVDKNGYSSYYINGKRHRYEENSIPLPAVIYSDGTVEYYINGDRGHDQGVFGRI